MYKILFIIPGYGKEFRGVENHFESVSTKLLKNFEIHLLSKDHDRDYIQEVSFHKVCSPDRHSLDWIYHNPYLSKLLKKILLSSSSELEAFLFCLKSIFFMLTNKYDLIIPSGGIWTSVLAKFLGKSAKVMSIGHSGFVRKEAFLSNLFVALTPNSLKKAKSCAPNTDSIIIPNGVDIKKFSPIDDEDEYRSDIACVGAFTEDKNHILLLNALDQIEEKLNVLFAGKGPLENKIRSHSAFKKHNILIKTFDFHEMQKVYQRSKIFTLASYEEAFGLVFLEALSTGTNVVANDCINHRYVCGDAGFYCNTAESSSYTKAIIDALNNDRKSENIAQAFKFSWDLVANQYNSAMLNLLEEKR